MTTELICAGFGGQGVLTIGRFIAKVGMKEGKNVSWLPETVRTGNRLQCVNSNR